MNRITHINLNDLSAENDNKTHENRKGFEYYRQNLVHRREGGQCIASIYEIPPNKSAYPYHYHTGNEECFYIIRGSGILRTPDGEKQVGAGDFLFFPTGAEGAHKLTNTSETEMLAYLDFDTCNDIDVTFYPDSGKLGVWGKGVDRLYKMQDNVDYYEGEGEDGE